MKQKKSKSVTQRNARPPDNESLLGLVADSVPALLAYYEGADLVCRFANRRYAEYHGWTVEGILGRKAPEVIEDDAWKMVEPYVGRVMQGKTVKYVREKTLRDGTPHMIEVNLIPHLSEQGEALGAFVMIHDISELWQAGQTLRDSEIRQRKFAMATEDGLVFHRDGVITDVNDAALRLTGYALEDVLGRGIGDFVPERHRQQLLDRAASGTEEAYEAVVLRKDGTEIPVEMMGKTLPLDGETYRLAIVRDITARRQAQARIDFLSSHDALTELPNRIYLKDHLPKLFALVERQKGAVGLLLVELDKFKRVNDELGTQAGDELLQAMAQRLQSVVRKSDFVARVGGDEFLVVLTSIGGKGDAQKAAEALLQTIRAPLEVAQQALTVHSSIGISCFPEDGQSLDELIAHAGAAMSRVKAEGGNAFRFFEPDLLKQP